MINHLFNFCVAVIISVVTYGCTTHEWQQNDMNSRAGPSIEADLKPGSSFCGFRVQCKFELHYFFGRGFDAADPERKLILYIPGGPGDIVDRANPNLDPMRMGANFIYFDVRGTGFSTIPESNNYDQFLRAEYVMKDIEALRQTIAKQIHNDCADGETPVENKCKEETTPWDAIYAHSWGTIVAQMYAAKYGKTHVKNLILSAPVSRAHGDTEEARRRKIVDNLIDLYRTERPDDGCNNQELATKSSPGNEPDPATQTFCFLEEDQMNALRALLTTLLHDIGRDYGSTAFVGNSYNDLKTDHDFTRKYPYPREFFSALRQLEWLGAGEDKRDGLRFEPNDMWKKMGAAFFLGYYLMLKDKPTDQRFFCDPDAEFLSRLKTPMLRRNFCKRINAAERALREEGSKDESRRARTVFGIYDGLARWIFEMLDQERQLDGDGCFRGKALEDVASGALLKAKKAMQEQAKRIGTSTFEKICPWDPKRYLHEVPTLIFTGNADPVTAGGQAEYFYENGLMSGKRVLVEFPGAGHLMSLQVKASPKEEVGPIIAPKFGSLVDLFLNESVDQYIEDPTIADRVKNTFGAKLFPPKPENKRNEDSPDGRMTQ